MRSSLLKEIEQLKIGEGASAIGFAMLWIMIAVIDEEARVYLIDPMFFVPFSAICITLATGSYFWSIMLEHVKHQRKLILTDKQKNYFKMLHLLIVSLMIGATILIIINLPVASSSVGLLVLIYGFMWLEYINYFHIRLSYLTPREFKQLLIHKPARAHLSRVLRSK